MILLSDYNTLCEKFNIPKLSLDFYSDTYNCVPSKQMDHARYLEVSLTEYGVFRPIHEGEEARIRLLKPNNTYVYNDCEILENGRLLVTLTDTILSYKGKACFDIVVNQPHHPAGEKGHVYSTKLAYLDIVPTPYSNEVIESSNEFSALLNAIDRVEDINHQAESSAETASQKAAEAQDSADQAGESAQHAAASASSSDESAAQASASAVLAASSEANAKSSETKAEAKAAEAENHANLAKSYACGDTGIRPNENIDNAKYYYEQSRTISETLSGVLRPMGTISFTDLPVLSTASAGDMYNIADSFVTTDDFKEGPGNEIPAGANIYKTSDGKWDVLAGSPVAGVKGNAEDIYRTGNVNISPEDIGAVSCDGGTEDNTVTFSSGDGIVPDTWMEVPVLEDGEKHRSLFGKISTMLRNVRYLYKVLGNADISGIGNGTATGAIRQLNVDVASKQSASTAITTQNIARQSVNYASSAGSVAWGNVSGKPDTFPPNTHSHNYLPTSGGNLTGPIEMFGKTPYIDFHFGGSTADYTSRIIEESSGWLNISGNNGVRIKGTPVEGFITQQGTSGIWRYWKWSDGLAIVISNYMENGNFPNGRNESSTLFWGSAIGGFAYPFSFVSVPYTFGSFNQTDGSSYNAYDRWLVTRPGTNTSCPIFYFYGQDGNVQGHPRVGICSIGRWK